MTRISSARIDLEQGRVDNAILKDYSEQLVGGASGTNAGAAYTVDIAGGKINGAIILDGTSQYLTVGGTVNLANISFSLAAWARRNSSGTWDVIFAQGTAVTDNGLHFAFRPNNVLTFDFWGDGLDTPLSYTDNLWHHFAGTYDASTNAKLIYIDGTQVASSTAAADYQGSGTFYIGSFNGPSSPLGVDYFGGSIDDARIYTRVLSPTEVQALYLGNSSSVSTSNLVAYWKFDETSGTTASDSSGNSHTATFVNSPQWGVGGNVFNIILNKPSCSLYFAPPVLTGANNFTLFLHQDADGNRTVAWPANILWGGGNIPILSTGAGAVDIFSFLTVDQGVTWFGSIGASNFPVPVSGSSLWTWGLGTSGETGNGAANTVFIPTQIGGSVAWLQLSSGKSHFAGIKTDGTLWTWGLNTTNGQLGLGDKLSRSSPTQVGTYTNWSSVAAGGFHTLAIKTDGTLWAWGQNTLGKLGLGDVVLRSSPVQVGVLNNWASVSAGNFSFATKTDGTLWGWGQSGYVGDNAATNKSSPVQIGTLTTWSSVSAGTYVAHAIQTDGTMWGWGRSTVGALGNGIVSGVVFSSPVQIGSPNTWTSVSGGGNLVTGNANQGFTFAIKTDGTLWAWGMNTTNGQLGLGDKLNRSFPTQVGTLTTWRQVSAGGYFSTAVKTDGTLWAWGKDDAGQLGQYIDTLLRSSPVQVGSATTWTQTRSSLATSAALKSQ